MIATCACKRATFVLPTISLSIHQLCWHSEYGVDLVKGGNWSRESLRHNVGHYTAIEVSYASHDGTVLPMEVNASGG